MRLTRLSLSHYGVFQSHSITFDPRPGCLNLLIAPNGAGKSVLRAAFGDLLFGIGGQTAMGFRYGYPQMRLSAEVLLGDGTRFAFTRRKGQGNTLAGADGTPLDPAVLSRALGGADRALLERLFALDTQGLRDGGLALLGSGGALAEALLSAAGGLREGRSTARALEAARDVLAPERRIASRPFYRALDAFTEARKRVGASLLKPDAREREETELAHLRAEQRSWETRLAASSKRLTRLERIRRVRGLLSKLDGAMGWRAQHPEAPSLPEGAGARLETALAESHRLDLLIAQRTEFRLALVAQIEAIAIDPELLGAAEECEQLAELAGTARNAERDLPGVIAEHEALAVQIAARLRDLSSPLTVGEAGQAIPPAAAVARIQALLSEHDTLRGELERLPREAAAKQAELAKAEAEVAALPARADLGGLKRLVREAGNDPALRAQQERQAQAGCEAALAAALRRVPGWTGEAEALADLRPLPLADYEALHQAWRDAAVAQECAAEERATRRAKLAQLEHEVASLAATGPIPDTAAMAAARVRRDAGWRLIYRRAFEAAPEIAAERTWASDVPLALAYERAVAAADAIADRRSAEAERIAKAERLRAALAEAARAANEAEHRCTGAQQRLDAVTTDWKGACAGLGLPVPTLAAARAFVAGREKVLDAMRDLANAQSACAELLEYHVELARRLIAALGAPLTDAGLAALLLRAEETIEEDRRADTQRARAQERLSGCREAHASVLREIEHAQSRQQTWRVEWDKALGAMRRPAAEPLETTRALLGLLGELREAHRLAEGLALRIVKMRDSIASFHAATAAIAARIAADLVGADPFEAARQLRARLGAQQKAAEARSHRATDGGRAGPARPGRRAGQTQSGSA